MMARLAGALLFASGLAQAHGVELKVEKQPGAVAVRFGYGPDEPVKGAPVKVFSPADAATPFQAGQTDQRGVFVFAPDRAGAWRVAADDGEGHREEARITVGEDGAIQFHEPGHARAHTFVTGVALLVGVTGIALWWSGRRRPTPP
jgi:uncharacterized GH25 family protein